MKKHLIILFFYLTPFLLFSDSSSSNNIQLIPQQELKDFLFEKIKKAKKNIYIAHYIFTKDQSGQELWQLLRNRAAEGVEIKIIFDGIGASPNFPLSKKEIKTEQKIYQIEIGIYHPKLRNLHKIHQRMHDKLFIIDEQGIIGSSGIWNLSFYGILLEKDFYLTGPITQHLKAHFFNLYESKATKFYFKKKKEESKPIPLTQDPQLTYIYDQHPRKAVKESTKAIEDLLLSAKKEIWIETPYFLPTKKFRKIIQQKSEEGVKIIVYTNSARVLSSEFTLPGIYYQQYFRFFKRAKIELYEWHQPEKMIHGKCIIVDSQTFYVGSFNLDRLSIRHNTENGLMISISAHQILFQQIVDDHKKLKQHCRLAFCDGSQLIAKETLGCGIKHFALWLSLPLTKNFL